MMNLTTTAAATTTTTTNEMIIESINAMKKQESMYYQTKDGVYYNNNDHSSGVVNEKCRRLIIAWYKQISSYYHFHDNTIAMAVNCLDRYVAIETSILEDRLEYRLASMACLYTAIKIHEQLALDPKSLSKLSRGVFHSKDIEEMEFRILTTLNWTVNAPTAFSFVELYLKLLSPSIINTNSNNTEKEQTTTMLIEEFIYYQINYATEHCQFLGMAASELAFTATYNAIVAVLGKQHPSIKSYGNIQDMIDVKLLPFQLENELWYQIIIIQQQRSRSSNNNNRSSIVLHDAVSSTKQEENKKSGLLRRSLSQQQLSPRCITMS